MQYRHNSRTPTGPDNSGDAPGNTTCDDCNAALITNDDGEYLCADCGLIHDEYHLDPGPSYTAYSGLDWQKKAHHGGETSVAQPLNGLGTVFYTGRDGYGRTVSNKLRKRYRRLKKHHDIYAKNKDRNFQTAFNELDALVSSLNLPGQVKDAAAKIYRKAFQDDLIRGRSIEGMVSASVLIAIRRHKIPRTVDELASVGHVDSAEIYRAFSYIRQELNIPTPPPSPFQWFNELAGKLEVEPHIRADARERLESIMEEGTLSGREPKGLAVATLYASYLYNHQTPFSQTDASEAADVGKQTVSNIAQAILERDGYELRDLHPWFKNPQKELDEFADEYNLPTYTRAYAEKLLDGVAGGDYLDERLPKAVAMAAVTVASIKTNFTRFSETSLTDFSNVSADTLSTEISDFNNTFNTNLLSGSPSISITESFFGSVAFAKKLAGMSIDILQGVGHAIESRIELVTGVRITRRRSMSSSPETGLGSASSNPSVPVAGPVSGAGPSPKPTHPSTMPTARAVPDRGHGPPGTVLAETGAPWNGGSLRKVPHTTGRIRSHPPPSAGPHSASRVQQPRREPHVTPGMRSLRGGTT